MKNEDKHDELTELKHDPVPGYRTALYVVLGITVLYLAVIFLKSS